MNPLETDEQGQYLCHWCKCQVPYTVLGIRTIVENGRVIRIGTCGEHFYNEPPVGAAQ